MLPKPVLFISLLIILCLLTPIVNAQISSPYTFKFKNYTTQNGLVHDFTRKCCKDSKGFLWIITQNGLSRFDGVNFKNFRNNPKDSTSLPYNDILDIAIDENDRIWLAYGSGLCYYDQRKQGFVVIRSAFSTGSFSLVYNEKKKAVWYNTYKGLFKINTGNLAITATSQQPAYKGEPYVTFADSKGLIWTGIRRWGYYVYNTANNTCKYYDNNYWPRGFYEDDEGKIWISTWGSGFQLFDGKDGSGVNKTYSLQPKQYLGAAIYQGAAQSIPLTGKNIIWVLTHTRGLGLFDKQQRKFVKWITYDPAKKSNLLNNFSNYIYTDKDGVIWICSWRGLSKINKQEQQFQSAELPALDGDAYNLIAGIKDDPFNNKISWLAVNGSGVAKYDKQQEKIVQWYYHDYAFDKNDIYYDWRWTKAMYQDAKKRLWLPTDGGLIKIENGSVDTVSLRLRGAQIFLQAGKMILANDDFWIFTSEGIVKFNTNNHQYKFYLNQPGIGAHKLLPANLFDGAFINNGQLLCAGWNGLYLLDTVTGTFKDIPVNIKGNNSLKDFMVVEKINNKVYIGGAFGLLEYNTDLQKFSIKGAEQEIFKLENNSLRKDSLNKLWIYTLHGLFRYDPDKDEFKKFTSPDGIYNSSSDPVQLFDYNKNMYIGYRMAYTKFNPLEIDINTNRVKPFVVDMKIDNRPGNVLLDSFAQKQLNLTYKQNNIVFEFTGIDYTNSEYITFEHMLEGFDKAWIADGTKRTATYQNLGGGPYVFKVRATNSHGIKTGDIAQVRFYIHPPFWQTWWFKILCVLAFVVAVILIALYRIKKIVHVEKEKTAVNKMIAELEMKALRSQMNPHFIFNSINSIQKYIWENKQEDASEYLTKFSKLVRIILDNSMKKLVTLEDEMISLQLYLELEHRRCNNKFDYYVNINNAIGGSILVPPMLMQPYIENAIWHGLLQKEGRGKLIIDISTAGPKTIVCTIEDDGIGRKTAGEIKKEKRNNNVSYGMQITQQRLSMTEIDGQAGKVIIEDLYTPGGKAAGTRIILEIPIETFEKIGYAESNNYR